MKKTDTTSLAKKMAIALAMAFGAGLDFYSKRQCSDQ